MSKKPPYADWYLLWSYHFPGEKLKAWVNESHFTDLYSEDWNELMAVVKKLLDEPDIAHTHVRWIANAILTGKKTIVEKTLITILKKRNAGIIPQ